VPEHAIVGNLRHCPRPLAREGDVVRGGRAREVQRILHEDVGLRNAGVEELRLVQSKRIDGLDLEIVAQEATRTQMLKMGQPATPAFWKSNPAWGRADDVNRVILPTVTFADRMSVYYGDTQVDFIWPGRAHTSGDALVRLPRQRILFLGDIGFFGVTPLNGSGFIADWIGLLDEVREPIVREFGTTGRAAERAMEQAGVKVSLANLRTFPCVRHKEASGELVLHGGFFAISDGVLHLLDEESGKFNPAI